jgi:hypothetical protein
MRSLTPGTPPNRLLRFGLGVIALAMEFISFYDLITVSGHGIDLEIPLRAAARWMDGGQPYLASSFLQLPGFDLPFLYPPFVLPFIAPLLALPRELVLYGWVAVCAMGSAAACYRLRVPGWGIPLFLMWPPFAEGIIAGNVQVLLFLCFVLLFFRRDVPGAPLHPTPRDPTDPATPALREGLLATTIAAFKVSQLHAWAYLLFRRPRAALLGVAVFGAVILATLPILGLPVWGDWVAQIRRAADPNWTLAGISVGRYVGQVPGSLIFAASIALLWFVPRSRAGVWIGLLGVLGAPSLHTYGLLFMLPAMLSIRREPALVAAFFVSTYTEAGMWIGIGIVALTFLASTRWSWLREPMPGSVVVSETDERSAGATGTLGEAPGAG